jgi:hypothetical protein
MIFGVVNESRLVSNAAAERWCLACTLQLQQHAAVAWSRIPLVVQLFPSRSAVPNDAALFVLADSIDAPGAEAYHTESSDRVTGIVDCALAQQDGVSPSVDLSHEVLEAFFDPFVNAGVSDGNGSTFDLEVCDGVQDRSYAIPLGDGTSVDVSDFVLPAWCDPQSSTGPYSWLDSLAGPFTKTTGGYLVYVDAHGLQQQLGKKPARRARSLRAKRRKSLHGPITERAPAVQAIDR